MENYWTKKLSTRTTRRTALKYGGTVGLGAAALSMIGCGDDDDDDTGDPTSTSAPGGSTPSATATATSASGPVAGGTLVIGWPIEPGNLDFATTTSFATVEIGQFAGQFLVRDDPKRPTGAPRNILPDLAESWEFSDDGLYIDFQLRPNVRFHDGTPFNAEAVKFNFEFRRDESNPYFMEVFKSITANQFRNITGVEVVGDLVARYHLEEPFYDWLEAAITTYPYGMFVSPTFVVDNGPEALSQGWPGTGPFKFEEYVPNDRVRLVRNDDYWGDAPLLDEVVFRPIPEAPARVAALRAGEVDLIIDVTSDQAAELDGVEGVQVLTGEDAIQSTMFANCNGSLDIRIRKALNYAISMDEACSAFFNGSCTPDNQYISVTNYAHEPGYDAFPHNPEMARALLNEAAYDGEEIRILTGLPLAFFKSEDEIVIQQLRDFGFNIKETRLEGADYFAKLREGTGDAFHLLSSGQSAAPPSQIELWFHSRHFAPAGFNRNYYSEPEVDRMLVEARSEPEQSKRATLYQAVQRRVAEDSPMILTSRTNTQFVGASTAVKDFGVTLLRWQNQDWTKVWLDRR